MALHVQHKLKLLVYNELKCGVGFEEYLQHVKGPSSRLLLKFRSGTHGLFEELDRHAKGGVGLRNVLIVGLVRSLLSMLFLSAHHMIPRDNFFLLYQANPYSGSIRSFQLQHAAFLIKLCFA